MGKSLASQKAPWQLTSALAAIHDEGWK